MDRCVVRIKFHDGREEEDLDIPLDISAIDLIIALNEIYSLGYDLERINEYGIKMENPICLMKGAKQIHEYGVMNGSIINITEM